MKKEEQSPGMEELLVDYVDKNLPPIRAGVEMIPVSNEGKELIYFHDPQGYLVKPFVLDKEIAALIPLLNGNYSVRDITTELKRYGSAVEEEQLLAFVRQLDEARMLMSPWFRHFSNEVNASFEQRDVRPAVCAGSTYPSDKSELIKMLDQAFSANGSPPESDPASGPIKALFAPHIDLRVGLSSYVSAFKPIAELKPRRVVLLATSHYAGMFYPIYDGKPFIATRKDFETPLGIVPADHSALDLLENEAETTGCTFRDIAHRNEHSIELHLIFLQYLWSHPFELVPLLVGSLEEMYYKQNGDIGWKVNAMAASLRKHFSDDEDTLFVISGDLAHIGKKFGDQKPASAMFDDVAKFDRKFLETAQNGETGTLLDVMKEDLDPYRICGFPPLYTALRALPGLKASVTSYELWDEKEQESAVTFGSLLYRKTL